MAIYSKDGFQLGEAFNVNGNSLLNAYDKSGNVVFTQSGTVLKVASYNVGQWYYGGGDNVPADQDLEYFDLQNGMISRMDADILCMCEYLDTFSKTGRTAVSFLSEYFPYIEARGGSSGYFGRAICSKYPITNYTHHSYSNESSRYYDSATVTVDGTPITVVITHLNYDNRDKRNAQLAELITFLSNQERFISCGDYNALYCQSTSDIDYTAIIVPLLTAGFHCANCTDFGFLDTYSDHPIGTYTGCLDNIVTSSNINIYSAYVDTAKLHDDLMEKADHMPIISTMVI